MKIIWKNGSEVLKTIDTPIEIELIGASFNGVKPDCVELDRGDLRKLSCLTRHQMQERLYNIASSLKKDF